MLVAYTDGACWPNPGRGGWAFVIVKDGEIIERQSGGEIKSTNNRMEFLALIKVVEFLGPEILEIYTDSKFLVKVCTDWRHRWREKDWKRVNRKPEKQEIKNLDLVQRIDQLLNDHPHIKVKWIKGHAGHIFNEAADELANKEAGIVGDPWRQYKKHDITTEWPRPEDS